MLWCKKDLKNCWIFFFLVIKSGIGNSNTFSVCCIDASSFSDQYQVMRNMQLGDIHGSGDQ